MFVTWIRSRIKIRVGSDPFFSKAYPGSECASKWILSGGGGGDFLKYSPINQIKLVEGRMKRVE